MRKPAYIKPTNPIRAWSRRIVRGSLGRPDVRVLQLQRRVEVLERITNVSGRASTWVDDFVCALTPVQFPTMPLERLGSPFDGGYVLPTGLPKAISGVVSIGVGSNNDVDVRLAEMGLSVHAWDHTVEGLPTVHESIKFHRVGLGEAGGEEDLLPLASIIDASFGSEASDLLLLIDAEGAEWEQFAVCSDATLDRFAMIAVEFHDLGDLILDPGARIAVLQRLNSRFAPVVVHPNNHAAVWSLPGLGLPDALEVTYVNRSLLRSEGTIGNCPPELLAPCCPDLPETDVSWVG